MPYLSTRYHTNATLYRCHAEIKYSKYLLTEGANSPIELVNTTALVSEALPCSNAVMYTSSELAGLHIEVTLLNLSELSRA